jgi:nucleotide-binding universal stress UspA family protein
MPLTVLVTLDGSDKDERAVPVAAALLELTEGRARVVRVLQPGEPPTSASGVHEAAAQLGADARREAAGEVLNGPDVAATLLRDVEANRVDFVVMATRAAGAVGRAVQGSVADQLVRESTCPVMLVPPRAHHLAGKRIQLRRVLVPLDGSLPAMSVLARLVSLPRAHTLEVVLIQAVSEDRTGGHMTPPGITVSVDDGSVHASAKIAEERLDAVAQRLRAQGLKAEVRVVESRDAGAVLIDATRHDHVDFVAMTTRGAGGLQRLVLGSVTEFVVSRSEIPVLLVTGRSSVTAVDGTIGAWR